MSVYRLSLLTSADASVRMKALEQRRPYITWESFVVAFLEHFRSGNTSDVKAQLSHMQQQGTVDEFFTKFTKLSCRAPDRSDADPWPMFCYGLKNELRHDVLAMGPQSLYHAHQLVQRYEAKLRAESAEQNVTAKSQDFWHGSHTHDQPAVPP
ncbi:hypothetical protein ACLB2K_072298 [Fragaria x ananassa]